MARQVIFLIFLLLVFLYPQEQSKSLPSNYKSIYKYAEQLYTYGNANNKSDSLATQSYHHVILMLKKSRENDSILFDSYVKAAILEMSNHKDSSSLSDFISSIDLAKHNKSLPDSLLFKSYLYAGSIYYSHFNFDSSIFYYHQAEKIIDAYPFIAESERLFNKLGVLYYETGDYKKSILYFEKALSIIKAQNPADVFFIVNYKNNIASALRKLRRYTEALTIYKSLLPYGFNTKELLHNISICYLDAGDAKLAIQYLRKVQYNNLVKYNDLIRANIALKQYDSAAYFLEKAHAEQQSYSSQQKNPDYGITLKYEGDLLMAKRLTSEALLKYQQAIIQVDRDFNDTTITHNPNSFYGLHTSFLLFDVLKAKAQAFAQQFSATNNRKDLINSFSTYSSALALATHVERMYHSDEAKLFLEQNVSYAYKEAVKTGLQLYELTKENFYLTRAFSLAESSKASVLQTDLHELELDEVADVPQNLVREQNNIKSTISGWNLQLTQTRDSAALQKLQNNLRDEEIRLSTLQNKLDELPGYSKLKFDNKPVSVDSIQHKILTKDEVLISYYYYENKLVCFYITPENFGYYSSYLNKSLFDSIAAFIKQLNASKSADRKVLSTLSSTLYQQLLGPVSNIINNKKRLLIIPYNELSYIPFEALVAPQENQPLLYKFSITYNYSANFLSTAKNTVSNYKALAMAPFSTASYNDALATLTYSKDEISGLAGKIFLDKEATKQQFVSLHSQFPLIHLATHAFVNDSLPLQSYIEFYVRPSQNDTSHRLYEQEIYRLTLQKTQLVILSACETGNGKLINEEGVISLSRAFSYAGCKSVITSLWKADDAATAFIIKKVHHYLKKGLAKDDALQRAKIDYLESSEIDARFKTPAYWAHLVLIGNNEPIARGHSFFYLIMVIIITVTPIVFIVKSRIQKSVHGFNSRKIFTGYKRKGD